MNGSFDTRETRVDLERLFAELEVAAKKALQDALTSAEQHARNTTQFQDVTGTTRKGIHAFVTNGSALEGQLISMGSATRFIEYGTKPHQINARGSAMRFVVNGQAIFARRVHHPGTRPRPFMQEARDHGEQVLDYGLELRTDEAITKE